MSDPAQTSGGTTASGTQPSDGVSATGGSVLRVAIVAADHPVWSGEASAVSIPASEGGMGILPNHEPVMTVIDHGTVVVTAPQGKRHAFEVTDGFIAFDSNKLTVAVDDASSVQAKETESI